MTSQRPHTTNKLPPYATEWNSPMKIFCVRHWLYCVHLTYDQGCSGAGTRGHSVPTPFSCFALRLVRSCFKMASLFGCVPTPFLLALHPCLWQSVTRAGLRRGQRGQLPRAPRCKGPPRDEIYLFQIKYSFEKFLWFRTDTRIQLYIIFLCCVKYQGPPTATDFSASLTVFQF